MQGMVNETNKLIVMHSIRFWTQICQKEYEILELKKVSSDPKSTSECQKKFYSKAALSYITPILLKHLEGNVINKRFIFRWNFTQGKIFYLNLRYSCTIIRKFKNLLNMLLLAKILLLL